MIVASSLIVNVRIFAKLHLLWCGKTYADYIPIHIWIELLVYVALCLFSGVRFDYRRFAGFELYKEGRHA